MGHPEIPQRPVSRSGSGKKFIWKINLRIFINLQIIEKNTKFIVFIIFVTNIEYRIVFEENCDYLYQCVFYSSGNLPQQSILGISRFIFSLLGRYNGGIG